MSALLLWAIISGNCPTCQKVVVQQVVPVYPTVAVPSAIITYQMSDTHGSEARLRKLEELVAIQTEVLQRSGAPYQARQSQVSPVEIAGRSVLNRHCISCHSGATPKGDLDFTHSLSASTKALAAQMMSTGKMPPEPRPKVPQEEFLAFYTWLMEDSDALREIYYRADGKSPPVVASTDLGP